jgi:hypothetical protein
LICLNAFVALEAKIAFREGLGRRTVRPVKIASILASGFLASFGLLQPANSHSGTAQDPWNPAHLEMLPPEIRADVRKWEAVCGGSIAAAQRFALYLTVPRAQFVALHYDDFRCRNKTVHCGTAGCLHEVYVSMKGRYRRVLAVHAYDVRLSSFHDQAVLELLDADGNSQTLLWNGSRFVKRR